MITVPTVRINNFRDVTVRYSKTVENVKNVYDGDCLFNIEKSNEKRFMMEFRI